MDDGIRLPSMPVLVLLAGVGSHYLFSRYEPWPHQLLLPSAIAFVLLLCQRHEALDGRALAALLSSLSLAAAYVSVVLASMAVYRVALHRLCRFPGPPLLALSKWSMLPDDVHGQRFRTIDALHARYGAIVRTGPRELSINDANVVAAVYGAQSGCSKGPWYRGIAGDRPAHEQSLYDTRDKHLHARRRKLWNAALSHHARTAHIGAIDALVRKTVVQLRKRAQSTTTTTTDMGEWCEMLSFDVMCEVGFSRRLNLIEQGARSRELRHLQEAVANAQVIGNLPYLSKVLDWLPSNRIRLFKRWVADVIAERAEGINADAHLYKQHGDDDSSSSDDATPPLSMPPSPPLTPMSDDGGEAARRRRRPSADVMGRLLRHQDGTAAHRRTQIVADGMLLAVGGSDTTSAALTMALYLLTKHASVAEDVRRELRSVLNDDDDDMGLSDAVSLAATLKRACPLLNAVIEETLRLYPPGLSGLQRETPAEGAIFCVDGKQVVIPPRVVVTVPTWTIQRDPRHFSPAPNAFRPQRWLHPEREERMNASTAFLPFGYGPTACAGREVAWVEMRIGLARFLTAFDFTFAHAFDEQAFEQGVRDLFTLHVTVPLLLQLRERKTSA